MPVFNSNFSVWTRPIVLGCSGVLMLLWCSCCRLWNRSWLNSYCAGNCLRDWNPADWFKCMVCPVFACCWDELVFSSFHLLPFNWKIRICCFYVLGYNILSDERFYLSFVLRFVWYDLDFGKTNELEPNKRNTKSCATCQHLDFWYCFVCHSLVCTVACLPAKSSTFYCCKIFIKRRQNLGLFLTLT